MGSGMTSQAPQYFHQQKISLINDNSVYTGADRTGNWVVFRSEPINSSQANYASITIVAHVEMTVNAGAGSSATCYCRAQISGTQAGQIATSPYAGNSYGGGNYGNDLVITLVAGTHYIRGTAFNLDFAQRGVVSGALADTPSANLLGYIIEGVSD